MIGKPKVICLGEDWGRHPSTLQHMMTELFEDYDVFWINSIGLREPSLTRADLYRAWQKLTQFLQSNSNKVGDGPPFSTEGLARLPRSVISPLVVPIHRYGWLRWLNRKLFARSLKGRVEAGTADLAFIIVSNPATYYLLPLFPNAPRVYYCADKYATMTGVNRSLVEKYEQFLLAQVDLIATSSQLLAEEFAAQHSFVEYLPHGVDYLHFRSTLDARAPEKYQHLDSKKVIGFVGLIGEHIDFDLVSAVADSFTDAILLMVGPIESDDIVKPTASNIVYTGAIAHNELPSLLTVMDVCIVPYLINERIKYANSTKVREYLASGRPVVATEQPGVNDIDGQLAVCSTPESFVDAITEYLTEPLEPGVASKAMQDETWRNRARQLITWVEKIHE